MKVYEWVRGLRHRVPLTNFSNNKDLCFDVVLRDGRVINITIHDNAECADYLDGAILVRGYRAPRENETEDSRVDREIYSISVQADKDGNIGSFRTSARAGGIWK